MPLLHTQASPVPLAMLRPVYSDKVSAGQSGFPSPAQDYEQKFLDLNERFVTNPPATFFFTVSGDSMIGAGIFNGDTLIVNRALKPKSSSIVIAEVDGEWMVKRLYKGYMVSTDARGRGIASIMCEHSQDIARVLDYKAMQFNFVASTNEGAIRLWTKLGFDTVGRLQEHLTIRLKAMLTH